MIQLRDYQENLINELARNFSQGKRRLIAQLATGGGKTVCFAGIINRYLIKQKKTVVVLVHRMELLKQTRKTLFNAYSLVAEPITAENKNPSKSSIYVGMVETANNRLKKNPNYFGEVGLLIVDECHIGNFKKLYEFFPSSLIIGFTATPISATKKDPIKNHFDDIVCGIDIPDLITSGSLVPNRTYHIKNIKRKELLIKNGEFDEKQMGDVFSKSQHVENCIEGYKEFAAGTKTLVFNCNIEHSLLVDEAFRSHGYNSRHLDGETDPGQRTETINWFKNTPDAILNNVGVLTTGFDEPSTRSIIINKSTMSLPLWLQMTGRGSRPFDGKEYFTIVDMGGNALEHGDWCHKRDWRSHFMHPIRINKNGEQMDRNPPQKECVECKVLIHAATKICPHCGAENATAPIYDEGYVEFEQLTNDRPFTVHVPELIEQNRDHKDYYTLHQIKNRLVYMARREWKVKELTEPMLKKVCDMYQDKVREWCKHQGRRYNQWHRETTTNWLMEELRKNFTIESEMSV